MSYLLPKNKQYKHSEEVVQCPEAFHNAVLVFLFVGGGRNSNDNGINNEEGGEG